jgi:hypothetical protein
MTSATAKSEHPEFLAILVAAGLDNNSDGIAVSGLPPELRKADDKNRGFVRIRNGLAQDLSRRRTLAATTGGKCHLNGAF